MSILKPLFRLSHLTPPLFALFAPLGCGGEPLAEEEEPLGVLRESLNGCYAMAAVSPGQTAHLLHPDVGFCYLTKISGAFSLEYSGSAEVAVGFDGYWQLTTTGNVTAEGTCVRRSCLYPKQADDTIMMSRTPGGTFGVGRTGGSCASRSSGTWHGDAATALTGMNGEFDGGGESIRVAQSTSGTVASSIIAQVCNDEHVGGGAETLFVGTPGTGKPALFVGPSGVTAPFSQTGGFSLTSFQAPINMARSDRAMCYLSRVAGKFRGGGERVQIKEVMVGSFPHWQLSASARQSDGVQVSANCFKLEQYTL